MNKENKADAKSTGRPSKDRNDAAMDKGIYIVNGARECRTEVKALRSYVKFRLIQSYITLSSSIQFNEISFSDCKEYNVLGINCDIVRYKRQRISLLILTSKQGRCVLILLQRLGGIPAGLRVCSIDLCQPICMGTFCSQNNKNVKYGSQAVQSRSLTHFVYVNGEVDRPCTVRYWKAFGRVRRATY